MFLLVFIFHVLSSTAITGTETPILRRHLLA